MSRIGALLALDAELLKSYIRPAEGEEDVNEENRAYLAHLYRNQLTDAEGELITDGDMNAIFAYIAEHLEKPTNGEDTGGGGATGGG
jgi:hypothetical protein